MARSDDFNRADVTPLSAASDGGSAWVDGASIGAVASNRVTGAYGSQPYMPYLETGAADAFVEVTCVTLTASANAGGPACRVSDYQNGYYLKCHVSDPATIIKIVAGSRTTEATCSEVFTGGETRVRGDRHPGLPQRLADRHGHFADV